MIVIVEPIPIRFCFTPFSNIAYTIMYVDLLGPPLVRASTVSKTWNERIDVIVTTKT
jgi:hypothetical protein